MNRCARIFTCVSVVALLWSGWLSASAVDASSDVAGLVIARGRTVDVRFCDTLQPSDLVAGADVQMEVASAVLVDGVVVISERAPVAAYVETVQRRGPVGKPAAIRVVVSRTEALDGTAVPLNGVYSTSGKERRAEVFSFAWAVCICGLLAPGEQVMISRGTLVGCFVSQEVAVGVDPGE